MNPEAVTDSSPAKSGDLPAGTQVGKYRIERKLGQGGMGAVYLAVLPVLGKRVAIKVLSATLSDDPVFAQRFLNEARATGTIAHRNIVDVFDFDRLADGRLYYAMEFLEGRTLADRLEASDLDLSETRRLLAEICDALAAAHDKGIVHRDLKPENIWIARPERGPSFVKILDFGIAKIGSDKLTLTGTQMGTPRYMAPEQWRGQGVDHRADLYSLGVILYETFTGRLPFEGTTAHELMLAHVVTPAPPPAQYRTLPTALDALIVGCLQKAPEGRPQSAGDLWRQLDAALATADRLVIGRAARGSSSEAADPLAGTAASGEAGTSPAGASVVPVAPATHTTGASAVGVSLAPAPDGRRLRLIGLSLLGVIGAATAGALALRGRAGGPERPEQPEQTSSTRTPHAASAGSSAGPHDAGSPSSAHAIAPPASAPAPTSAPVPSGTKAPARATASRRPVEARPSVTAVEARPSVTAAETHAPIAPAPLPAAPPAPSVPPPNLPPAGQTRAQREGLVDEYQR